MPSPSPFPVIALLLFFSLCLSSVQAQSRSPFPSACDPNDPERCPDRTVLDPPRTPFPTPEPPGPCVPDPYFPQNAAVVTLYKGNVLGWFLSGHAESVHLILVRGVVGLLKAIDVRYSDGLIYGYADCNRIYRLDLVYGNATVVSELDVPLNGSYSVGFEFDPSNSTLARLVGNGGKTYLVNVETGTVLSKSNLKYSRNDTNFRTRPMVLDAGFSFTDNETSRLFVVDAAKNGTLSFLDDPEIGLLTTVGSLGGVLGKRVGFDIVQFDKNETASEIAVMVSVNRYWLVDVTDGSVTRIWRRSLLRKIPYNSWGLTVVPPQFLSSAFGELTADYVTTLYEVGGHYGNCTSCGTCPWDDRVVLPADDSLDPGHSDGEDDADDASPSA